MSSFIKNILLFSISCLIAYPLLIFGFASLAPSYIKGNISNKKGAYGHLHSRINEVEKKENVQLLALGSSLCYRGIDPRIFAQNGYDLFNLGSSSQTHIQTEILLNKYLEKLNPELVIYECSPQTLRADGVESSIDIMSNVPLNMEMFQMATKINNPKTYNTLINMFFRNQLGLDNSFVESSEKGKDTYVTGGFVEREVEHYKKRIPLNKDPEEFIPRQNQLEAFKRNISKIKASGAKLILFSAPSTEYKYYSNASTQSSDSLLSSLGDFTNFNELTSLNDSLHFYDSGHLNQDGVLIFNQIFIDNLLK